MQWRRRRESNPRVTVLQTVALTTSPLRHRGNYNKETRLIPVFISLRLPVLFRGVLQRADDFVLRDQEKNEYEEGYEFYYLL